MTKTKTQTKVEFQEAKLHIGDILEELNKRAKSYLGWQGMNVRAAQDQALTDFAKHVGDGGGYVRLTKAEVEASGKTEFFRTKGKKAN
jgi:hypothetical protein